MKRWLSFFALLPLVVHAQRGPERTYDLQHIEWQVSLDEPNESLAGDVVNVLTLLKPVAEVRFDSVKLDIDRAWVDGKPATFRTTPDAVYVKLPRAMKAGTKVSVRLTYRGRPEAGVYFVPAKRAFPARTPIVYTQGEMEDTRFWLPTYDFPDDKATSAGTIDVPKGWSVLSNGKLLGTKPRGDRSVWRWRIDQPHSTYLVSFVAGPYTEVQDGKRKLPVSYWVPKGLESQGAAAFANTDDMIQIYDRLLGVPYPYAKFAQSAVADYMFGGMENISAVTQTIDTLHEPHLEPLANSEGLVAHELAHQWFGDYVTAENWGHIWINEGFATFMPAFIERERRGDDAYALARLGAFEGGLGAMRGEPRPMVYNKYKDAMELFDGHAYAGGAARLHMLMHQIGEEPFWRAMKAYLELYGTHSVTTDAFFASYGNTLGRSLESFKTQWFERAAVPSLTVRRTATGFQIEQSEPTFDLPLEYAIVRPGAAPERVKAAFATKTLAVDAPAGSYLLLDPDVWLMANISYEGAMTAADWGHMLRLAGNAAARRRILDAASVTMTDAQRIAAFEAESNADVKLDWIGRIRDRAFLMEKANGPDIRQRQAAVGSLDAVEATPAVISTLAAIADGERNDILRLAATRALVKKTKDAARVERAYATDSHQDSFRVWAIEWWTENDPNRAREVALAVVKNPPSEPVRKAALRALGRVKDLPGESRAFNALASVMDERSVGALRAAIDAFRAYGSKRALPLLEKRRGHSLHFIRNQVEEVIAALSK